jgi:hypothetical protein
MAKQLLAAIHKDVSFKKDIYEIANAMLHSTSTSNSILLRELLTTIIESAKDIRKFKCVLPLAFMIKLPGLAIMEVRATLAYGYTGGWKQGDTFEGKILHADDYTPCNEPQAGEEMLVCGNCLRHEVDLTEANLNTTCTSLAAQYQV